MPENANVPAGDPTTPTIATGNPQFETVTVPLGDKPITIETGKLAKQADGAVTVRLGETVVIVAAVGAAKAKEGQDFFPLTVDYREKAAAAGKFPGGYFKREGRPTEKEILTSRLIDRPIRPLFPKGWYNEVQVQCIVMSADGENDPDILAVLGASAALMVSDIPWAGPLAAVRVGRVKGQFVANPTHPQMAESDLDLVYVGNETDLVMFEGSAKEVSEADFNAALQFGHQAIQPGIAAQKDLAARSRQTQTPNLPQDRARGNPGPSQGTGGRAHRHGLAHAREAGPRGRRFRSDSRDRQKTRRAVWGRKGHRVRAQGRLLLHPKAGCHAA